MDDIPKDLISLRPTIHRHDECITLPDLQHAFFCGISGESTKQGPLVHWHPIVNTGLKTL